MLKFFVSALSVVPQSLRHQMRENARSGLPGARDCMPGGILRAPRSPTNTCRLTRAQHILLSSLPSAHEKRDPERSSHWSKGKEPGSGEVRFKPRTAGFRVMCTAPALLTASLSNACLHPPSTAPKAAQSQEERLLVNPHMPTTKLPATSPFLVAGMSPGARLRNTKGYPLHTCLPYLSASRSPGCLLWRWVRTPSGWTTLSGNSGSPPQSSLFQGRVLQ